MLVDLTHLAEVSLVLTEEIETLRGIEIRFRMLETMREYALEQMSRDERTRIADRHARFFMEIAERYAADIHPKFRDSLDADYDNLIAALQWAVESSKADIAIRLATSMVPLWLWRQRHSEGRRFLEGVLSVPGLDAGLVAGALRAIGILCFYIEDYAAALEYFHRQLDIVRELNDAQAIASALSNMAIAEQGLGRAHKAKQLMDESLERLIVLGEADRIPCAHFNLADIHEELGELNKARDLYILGLKGYAAVHSASGQAMCCVRLGMLAKRYGDLAAAKALFEQALQFEATLGKALGHPDTLKALAETLDSLGQHEAAIAALARRELALAGEYDLSNS